MSLIHRFVSRIRRILTSWFALNEKFLLRQRSLLDQIQVQKWIGFFSILQKIHYLLIYE